MRNFKREILFLNDAGFERAKTFVNQIYIQSIQKGFIDEELTLTFKNREYRLNSMNLEILVNSYVVVMAFGGPEVITSFIDKFEAMRGRAPRFEAIYNQLATAFDHYKLVEYKEEKLLFC